MVRVPAVAVAIACCLLGWQQAEGQAISATRQAELRHLLKQDCGSCHGLTLKGGLGPSLLPERLKGRSPEAVARIILDGLPDTAMPPWRPFLNEPEAEWLAEQLLKGRGLAD